MTEAEQLKMWEQYRAEMENYEDQMVKYAKSLAELKAYREAANCLGKASAASYMRGRMPRKLS